MAFTDIVDIEANTRLREPQRIGWMRRNLHAVGIVCQTRGNDHFLYGINE